MGKWAKLATLPAIFSNKVLLDYSQANVCTEWLVAIDRGIFSSQA